MGVLGMNYDGEQSTKHWEFPGVEFLESVEREVHHFRTNLFRNENETTPKTDERIISTSQKTPGGWDRPH